MALAFMLRLRLVFDRSARGEARRGNQTRAGAERLRLTRTADRGPEPLARVEVSLGLEHAYLRGSHSAYIRLRQLGGAGKAVKLFTDGEPGRPLSRY